MYYWNNKDIRKQLAADHTRLMDTLFHDEIEKSVLGTKIYSPGSANFSGAHGSSSLSVIPEDSVSAVIKLAGTKINGKPARIALLNFASYKDPGGMFMEGSSAQEESICHESFLYNVLSRFPEYYEQNNRNKNWALYHDRALYSPGVRFVRGGMMPACDVITCAAPNKAAFRKVSMEKGKTATEIESVNSRFLRSRISFIREIAILEGVDILITGAFGCGVFGQDPEEVAELEKEIFIISGIQRVVFAIPEFLDPKMYETFAKHLA